MDLMTIPGPLNMGTGNATLDAIAIAMGAAPTILVIEWAILVSVALLFTALRTYARARISGLNGFKWDDYLVWMAFFCFAGLTVNGTWLQKCMHEKGKKKDTLLTDCIVYIIGVTAEGLANDSISEARRAALIRDGVGSQEVQLRALGSKAQISKWILYALVLWLLKSSLLHFFAVRLAVRWALLSINHSIRDVAFKY